MYGARTHTRSSSATPLSTSPKKTTKPRKERSGQLLLCLCGTRDVAKEWQKTLLRHLQDIGFVPGCWRPAVFRHPERDMRVLVHGDDYLTRGHVGDLD